MVFELMLNPHCLPIQGIFAVFEDRNLFPRSPYRSWIQWLILLNFILCFIGLGSGSLRQCACQLSFSFWFLLCSLWFHLCIYSSCLLVLLCFLQQWFQFLSSPWSARHVPEFFIYNLRWLSIGGALDLSVCVLTMNPISSTSWFAGSPGRRRWIKFCEHYLCD